MLVGPRQAGKTTLARSIGGRYFDLEQQGDRLRLDLAWPSLLGGEELIILDEAHAWPEVFERLRGAIDADRGRCGRFLLLGSVSPALMTHVAESLAGRLAIVELSPLLLGEVGAGRLADLWLHGGYPDGGVLGGRRYPTWQRDYLSLLAARDLPTWGLPARPQVTDRLLRMLAALHGQTWNASQVGAGLGLSYHTVDSYLDCLEGAFLLRRLRPWSGNLKKRLVKRPKVFWRDPGLLHALLLVRNGEDLLGRPWVGSSWEGYVVEQAIATAAAAGRPVDATFFRTSDGHQLDLVLDFGAERWAIEAKLSTSPSVGSLRRLETAAAMVGAERRFLVSRTPDPVTDGATWSCGLPELLEELRVTA